MIVSVAADRPPLDLSIPDVLIQALAERVAEIILDRLDEKSGDAIPGRWMRSNEAAAYLGWSRQAIYDRVSRRAMPYYKVDGILLFKRDELDSWLAEHKQEPREPEPRYVPQAAPTRRRSSGASSSPRGQLHAQKPPKEKRKKRERPLPPPLSGDEDQKNHWARELEIARAELDEMSPRDFNVAWETRNQRLRDGGVFDHLTELTDAHGWNAVDEMTPSELIKAVADLGLASVDTSPDDDGVGRPSRPP